MNNSSLITFDPKSGKYLFDFKFGLGPLLKTVAVLYLVYLVLFKKLKIPSTFFIIYGIGSLLYVNHLYNLSVTSEAFLKIMNKPSVLLLPSFIEHSFIGILVLFTGLYTYSNK